MCAWDPVNKLGPKLQPLPFSGTEHSLKQDAVSLPYPAQSSFRRCGRTFTATHS